MSKLFDLDSPVIQTLNKLADLIILNILVLFSCIPIVSIGASQVALYEVTRKLTRDEGTLWRNYWSAFRSNFKQATIVWLFFICGSILILFCIRYYLHTFGTGTSLLITILFIVSAFWLFALSWVFPLQSKFENKVKDTISNAFKCSFFYIPRTVAMTLINFIPFVLLMLNPPIFFMIGPVWLFLWFSLAARINWKLLKKPFSVLEDLSKGADSTN